MITAKEIKDRISEMCSHFTFDYNNRSCGVDPIFLKENKSSRFDMWYGEDIHEAKSIDEVMTIPFFNGKTLNDIAEDIEIIDF